MKISYSELEAYRQCRFKHQLGYHERWTSTKPSKALALGSAFHELMEVYYNVLGGGELDSASEQAAKRLAGMALSEEDIGLLNWMMEGYASRWGQEDNEWEIVKTEEWIEIDLGEGVVFHGKIDLQLRQRSSGDLWIMDHKTCQNLPKDLDLDLDDQLGLYIWGKRKQGVAVRGGIQNSIRKQRNVSPMALEERFSRKMTYRTDLELDTMVKEARELALEAEANRGPGDRPRSPNPGTCGWKCDFTEACLHGRKYGSTKARQFLEETGFKVETETERKARREKLGMKVEHKVEGVNV